MKAIGNFIFEISQKLLGETTLLLEETKPEHFSLLDQAHQDWQAALSFFDNVSEKGLIDHAIYNLNAAEQRYFFLLKEARRGKKRRPFSGGYRVDEGEGSRDKDA